MGKTSLAKGLTNGGKDYPLGATQALFWPTYLKRDVSWTPEE
jgi:hypothetical protein